MFGFNSDGTCNWCDKSPCECKQLTQEEISKLPPIKYSSTDPKVTVSDIITTDLQKESVANFRQMYITHIDEQGNIFGRYLEILHPYTSHYEEKWIGPYKVLRSS